MYKTVTTLQIINKSKLIKKTLTTFKIFNYTFRISYNKVSVSLKVYFFTHF